MTEILKLTYGIFPKTEKLRIRIGRWGRGILSAKELEELISSETGEFQQMARDSGIQAFTDPLFNWYDIFRPLSALSGGIEFGPLTRYGETNTFYRLPEVRGNLTLESDPSQYQEVSENPPLPLYHLDQKEDQLAFVPGPETFFHFCGNIKNSSFEELSGELGKYYSLVLSKFNFKRTFVFESVPFAHDDLSAFYKSIKPENTVLFTKGNLEKSTLSSAGAKFHSVITTAEGDNFSVAASHSEIPGLALVDAHNTRLENPTDVASIAHMEAGKAGVENLYVTHTNYLDFLPRKIADRKIELIGRIGE